MFYIPHSRVTDGIQGRARRTHTGTRRPAARIVSEGAGDLPRGWKEELDLFETEILGLH